jgi:hypothetical protein
MFLKRALFTIVKLRENYMATDTVMVYDRYGALRYLFTMISTIIVFFIILKIFITILSENTTQENLGQFQLTVLIMIVLLIVMPILVGLLCLKTAKKIPVAPLFIVSQKPNYWDTDTGKLTLAANFGGLGGYAIHSLIKTKNLILCKEGLVLSIPIGLKLHRWNKFKKYTVNPDKFEFIVKIGKNLFTFYSKENFDAVNRLLSENIPHQ